MNRRKFLQLVSIISVITLFFKKAFAAGNEKDPYGNIQIPTKIIQPDIYPPTRAKEFSIFQIQKSTFSLLKETQTRKFDVNVWTYNGITPAKIVANSTQKFFIDNQLEQSSSIDFSYISSKTSAIAGLTMPIIAKNTRQTFSIDSERAGTFIFRSNVNALEQNSRGLSGIWIVPDKNEISDSDYTLAYQDFIVDAENQITIDQMHPGAYVKSNPKITNITVNNLSLFNISFRKNERIRLRIVNLCVNSNIVLSFYGLYGYIVALDSVALNVPLILDDKISISPSQSITLLVDMYTDKEGQIYVNGNNEQGKVLFTPNRFKIRDNALPLNTNPLNKTETPKLSSTVSKFTLNIGTNSSGVSEVLNDYLELKNITKDYSEGAENPFPRAQKISKNGFNTNYKPIFTINGKSSLMSAPIFVSQAGKGIVLDIMNDTEYLLSLNVERHLTQLLGTNGTKSLLPYFRDVHTITTKNSILIGFTPINKGVYLIRSANQAHLDMGLYGYFVIR